MKWIINISKIISILTLEDEKEIDIPLFVQYSFLFMCIWMDLNTSFFYRNPLVWNHFHISLSFFRLQAPFRSELFFLEFSSCFPGKEKSQSSQEFLFSAFLFLRFFAYAIFQSQPHLSFSQLFHLQSDLSLDLNAAPVYNFLRSYQAVFLGSWNYLIEMLVVWHITLNYYLENMER